MPAAAIANCERDDQYANQECKEAGDDEEKVVEMVYGIRDCEEFLRAVVS